MIEDSKKEIAAKFDVLYPDLVALARLDALPLLGGSDDSYLCADVGPFIFAIISPEDVECLSVEDFQIRLHRVPHIRHAFDDNLAKDLDAR